MNRRVVGFVLLFLICSIFGTHKFVYASGSTPQLLITEVQTQSLNSQSEEFIEIYNQTNDDVDISGLSIYYITASGKTISQLTLEPQLNNLFLGNHSFLLLSRSGYITEADAEFNKGLDETGGHIEIRLDDTVLDRVGWGTAAEPEGSSALSPIKGDSLSRKLDPNGVFIDTQNNQSDFISSQPSPKGGGSYELLVDVCSNIEGIQVVVPENLVVNTLGECVVQSPDICLNLVGEQLELPEGYTKNQDGSCVQTQQCLPKVSEISAQPNKNGQEYIEFFNESNHEYSLKLCKISINGSSEKSLQDIVLKPGGYYTAMFSSGTIRNSAGEIVLINSNNEETVYQYPATTTGQSINFSSDQSAEITQAPTPNATNKYVVLGEDPPDNSSTGLAACPTGKYRNPATNRCKNIASGDVELSPCSEGQYRNPDTNRCRKIMLASATLKPCDTNQERNPATNRCRKVASISSSLKPCQSGYERSPATNRCRKTIASLASDNLQDQPKNSKVSPLLDNRIIAAVIGLAIAYGIYEYRLEIINLYNRILAKIGKARPPD